MAGNGVVYPDAPVLHAEAVLNPERWNRFVDENDRGLPLHYLDFLTLLAQGSGREIIPLGVFGEDRLEGVAPLIVERRGPKGILLIAKSVDFFDGLVPSIPTDRVLTHLELIMKEAKRHGVGITTFSVFPVKPLEESVIDRLRLDGYEVNVNPSFVLPVAGRDTKNIRGVANRRIYRNLVHARECGVRVRDATEYEMEEVFPRLAANAYSGTGATFPFSAAVFGEIWRRYHEDSRFTMRSACAPDPSTGENVVIGMGLMIDNGRCANFWKLATRGEYEYMQPSTVLYLDALTIASRKGIDEIDTGGAPSKGIAEYKTQWGARTVPYYYVRRVNIPLYGPIDRTRKIFEKAKRLRSRGKHVSSPSSS